MKKYAGLILVVFILLITIFSGCINDSNSEIDKFIGNWETDQGLTLIFNKNGTCIMQGWASGRGEWNISSNRLFVTLEFTDGKNYMAYDYKFSDNDNLLTLTDASGNSWVYSKQ